MLTPQTLTPQEKSKLKLFVASPDYQLMQKVADMLITQIRSESTMKDSEWETLRETVGKEGQVTGITRFIKELFNNVK